MDHDDDDFGDENEDDEDDMSLEDDEFDNERYEVVIRRVVDNDPNLTSLSVGVNGTVPPNNDWGSLGRAIGINTQLRKLMLHDGLPTDEHELTSFVSGLAANRSIETLIFEYIQLNNNVIDCLTSFLADNQVFHCITVGFDGYDTDIKTTQLCLVSLLLMFDYLREFRLQFVGPLDHLDIIIQALGVHTGLRMLELWGMTIGRRGCNSLVRLLHKSTELKKLYFDSLFHITNDLDDGWQSIFTALQSTRCKLEEFEITGVEGVNARTADCLSEALLHCSTTLKHLNLNMPVMVVIPLLQDPNAILGELYLVDDDSSITNEEFEALTNALLTNSRLKRLELSGNSSITAEEWVIFSAILRNPNSNLDWLRLESNHINDTVMNSFADASPINHRLRELGMYWCDDTPNQSKVTSIGYDTFTCTLCNSSSILNTFNSNHSLEKVCLVETTSKWSPSRRWLLMSDLMRLHGWPKTFMCMNF